MLTVKRKRAPHSLLSRVGVLRFTSEQRKGLPKRSAQRNGLSISMLFHCHAGIQEGVKIVPYAPFVIPFVTPVMSYPLFMSAWMPIFPIALADHEHEIIGTPGLGEAEQWMVGNAMWTHAHIFVGVDVEAEGAVSISTIQLTPPPII